MRRLLTAEEVELIENALMYVALDNEDADNKAAQKLYDMIRNTEYITLLLYDNDGENKALRAMEAGIHRGETSYGDD